MIKQEIWQSHDDFEAKEYDVGGGIVLYLFFTYLNNGSKLNVLCKISGNIHLTQFTYFYFQLTSQC